MKMRRIALVGVLTAAAALGGATSAGADGPDPDEFTPAGYAFCGWLDLETKQWKMVWNDGLSGAVVVLFARNMSCTSARKNYSRMRPWGKRAGYRCKVLEGGHEFLDLRCSKRGRPNTAFRVQTGA